MDLDNITIPTTPAGLGGLLPAYLLVHLTNTPAPCKDLPNYVPVGTCGFTIYCRATYDQRVAACDYIYRHGPPVFPSNSPYLFSTSTLCLSIRTLVEAFAIANITHVAIFAYGMKCHGHMDLLDVLPPSPPTNSVRRYDIGFNHQSLEIPTFALKASATGEVKIWVFQSS